jgi:apolipoprotein D and lipocalin family protein
MKIFTGALGMFVLTTIVFSQENGMQELKVVSSVDLQKYAGTWYEIARKQDGEILEAKGRARLAEKNGPTSKLEVRFAPGFLSWLPFVWGDYWIIDLAKDYSYAVVGEPNRRYLWILSRTKTLDANTLKGINARIQTQGYDPSKLVMTPQLTASGE